MIERKLSEQEWGRLNDWAEINNRMRKESEGYNDRNWWKVDGQYDVGVTRHSGGFGERHYDNPNQREFTQDWIPNPRTLYFPFEHDYDAFVQLMEDYNATL